MSSSRDPRLPFKVKGVIYFLIDVVLQHVALRPHPNVGRNLSINHVRYWNPIDRVWRKPAVTFASRSCKRKKERLIIRSQKWWLMPVNGGCPPPCVITYCFCSATDAGAGLWATLRPHFIDSAHFFFFFHIHVCFCTLILCRDRLPGCLRYEKQTNIDIHFWAEMLPFGFALFTHSMVKFQCGRIVPSFHSKLKKEE